MIAIDNQPFSIVNDKGFIELLAHLDPRYLIQSRKYFNEVMLQRAYQNLMSDISKLLKKSSNFTFTTEYGLIQSPIHHIFHWRIG